MKSNKKMSCRILRKICALFALLLTMSMTSIDKVWGQTVPTVETVDVIHIQQNYAVGVGKVTNNGSYTVTERGVCWNNDNQNPPTIDGSHATSGTGAGNYSVDMNGLVPNTTYFMRAYVTYDTGEEEVTVYGAVKKFHTHVHMQNGTIEVDSQGFDFTDSDADPDGGWYYNYDEFSLVFIPKNTSYGIQIVFDSLLINNDMLYFYDGDISPNNLIGVFTCNEYHAYNHNEGEQISVFGLGGNLFSVTSHNYMTVRFVADYHWRDFGWHAHVTQVPFTPQPPTIAKIACSDDTFVLLPTSKGNHSTTLQYSVAYGGAEPDEPTTTYTEGTPININGDYPVKFKVKTEVMDSAEGESRSSETRLFTFGNESLIVHPDTPEIQLVEGTSSVTISVVRPGALNDTWKILYTLDGTDPSTSTTAQAITSTTEDPGTHDVTTSGTVGLNEFCEVKAVVQGTTCPNVYSGIASFVYDNTHTLYLLPPTISFEEIGDGSTAYATIIPPTNYCNIYYTVNGGSVQTYSDPFIVNANDHVEAWVTKDGNYVDSPHADATYLPGANNPGGGSGLFGNLVYLDDREDHSLSYYSDGNQPVHSLHPADVKITYYGFGNNTMTTTNTDNNPANSAFNGNVAASDVAVGPNDPGNQFVYYETLESGSYAIDASGYVIMTPDYEGTSHDYPYSLIPNPFSKRPTGQDNGSQTVTPETREIYLVTSGNNRGRGTLTVTYTNAAGVANTTETVNINSNNFNDTRSITVKVGTTITVSLARTAGTVTTVGRYDDANNGTQVWNFNRNTNGTTTNNYNVAAGSSTTIPCGIYRGFYAWRVKHLEGVTIKDAYNNTYNENSIIPAETRVLFHTENEYDNEVEFEALWAQAYVVTSNTANGLNANVSYERNFVVGEDNIGTAELTVPVTYSSYYPDGTSAYTGNVTLGDFNCEADTKFENMNLYCTGSIISENHYLCFGHGISMVQAPGRVEGIYNTSGYLDLDYTIRIESGSYNRLAFVRDTYNVNGGTNTIRGRYLVKGIVGSDYDRAKNDNSKLHIGCNDGNNQLTMNRLFLCYGLTFSSNLNKDIETFNLVVKSGTYQNQYWDNGGNGRYDRSFYVGQNYTGGYPGVRFITVKGGEFGSMNGGRGTSNYDHDHVDPDVVASTIRIKGGTFHGSVFGGAADNMTPGSRRIVVTGRHKNESQEATTTLIQGWIAGGCNGTGENGEMGCVDGNSYIYVGGEAVIGGNTPITVNGTMGGNVFGAGRGITGYNYNGTIINQTAFVHNSNVVIADNAKVTNNVYGGGFHGYVTDVSNVYIIGGEVGHNVYGGAYDHGHTPAIPATRVHIRDGLVKGSVYGGSDAVGNIGANDAIVTMVGGTVGTTGSLQEGSVFGGGYLNANVESNTYVSINGGLIVNNVYGGGNLGWVQGKATVNIEGGEVGDVHLNDNPTKGNVYGGGKGVSGAGQNTYVNETEVNIIGSYIMGSVFGGGENGHVLTNAVVNVNGGQVGGYSGEISGGGHIDCDNPYHGSVYGGGSGLNLDENGYMIGADRKDGWVKGNTTVNIVSGAHIMRNVYGGSNVASVGRYQGDDNTGDPAHDGNGYCIPGDDGLATVNISGGIIGTDGHNKTLYNDDGEIVDVVSNGMVFGSSHGKAVIDQKDFAHVNETHVIIAAGTDIRGSVFGGGDDGFVLGNTLVEIIDGTVGIPLTSEECVVDKYGAGEVVYTGNVYGGGRGIDKKNNLISTTAGFVKGNTEVRMTGGLVRHNVYGGGSLANVGYSGDMTTGLATVHISGGQVGSTGINNGNVFGSGRGMPANPDDDELMKYANLSNANKTEVTIDGTAKVIGSVFGGGENGHVLSTTLVNIDGQATIGNQYMYVHTGNVYGGGRGIDRYVVGSDSLFSITAGKVYQSTEVNVMNGLVYHHVYGGGNMASVGLHDGEAGYPDPEPENFGLAKVTVSGGVIGVDGNDNGHVFGSCHGWAGEAFQDLAYTRYTDVTITDNALVHGSVFGSGEDGHVLKDTHVTIEGDCVIGTIGNTGYEGNVYGGGRGTTLDENGELSPTAGKTFGNTVVDMTSGWVKGSVFGGGRVASVGVADEEPDDDGNYHTGHTLVTISGGEVGTTADAHDNVVMGGNVYGGGKGYAGVPYRNFTYTKNTEVHIQGTAKVHGSVFGAGEDGHTRQTTEVYIEGGEVGDRESQCTNRYHGNVYGGGRGIDFDESGNYSWTAGHVNWSTYVRVSGGRVFRNVYGGGNIASVGVVATHPELDTVLLRPNGISQLAPYDVVPVDKFGHPRYTYEIVDDEVVWSEDPNPLYGKEDDNSEYSDDNLTGWARVDIIGGIVGSIEDQDHEHGNVFGSCHGKAGAEYQHMAFVINTDVHVDYGEDLDQGDANNIIQGSVFGGGEDGHVNMNTKVTVNHGKIGNMENDDKKGNVYGGGRGIDMDASGNMSPSAGLVKGHTRVYINGGYISNSVFAGANMSAVWQEKVVNINGGLVKGSVYGGSKSVPMNRLRHGLKTVNVRNGHIFGNVYGCSYSSTDGFDGINPVLGDFHWTAFVNISGGLIDGNVHGAGYSSLVNGSTCISIGKNAILYAKNHPDNLYYNDKGGEEPVLVLNDGNTETIEPKVDNPLIIHGSVYGGSDYYGSEGSGDWAHSDVNGITNMLIDGKGYNTTTDVETATAYMSIDGGLFGCSTHCESGDLGRHILLRNYGTRNVSSTNLGNEMTSASRTLTTIQRCNNLIVDNANVNLSGMSDITGQSNRNYAVLYVDDTLYMANASGLNLGSQTTPAYMDSIFAVRSLHTMNNDTIYNDFLYKAWARDWEWIGVAPLNPDSTHILDTSDYNTLENARLYYRTSAPLSALTYDQENVILFNGDSRLWVRYHRMVDGVNKQLYGELQGFFRMKSPFLPHGTESFAFARPKTTANNNNLPQIVGQPLYINLSDGGFLSYETEKNFFTQRGNFGGWYYPVAGNDGGKPYTRTKQYPYTNVLETTRDGVNVEEYREWIIPLFNGNRWYVDGRGIGKGGWGMDKRHQKGWGHFPDMPKETVSGGAIVGDTLHMGGICYDDEHLDGGYAVFHPNEDIIYVVGPISADKENNTTTEGNQVTPTEMNRWPEQYTLRLYRYPGGHKMSNDSIDTTISTNPHLPVPNSTAYTGFGFGPSSSTTHEGPGANDTTMLIVEKGKSIIMDNVYMDGLYGYDNLEVTYHEIPTTFKDELNRVTEPLVTTYPNSTLTMRGDQPQDEIMITKYGTVLRRGCNNLEAYDWYTDADYNDTIHHGGGIYVNVDARVEVEELVTVDDNLQTLQYPDEDKELINCNVYLPTFAKHLYITNELNQGSAIGVTSPIRNTSYHYVHNTFSPVAVADKTNAQESENESIAFKAWENNNFLDDQQWFFVNGHTLNRHKDTYYSTSILDYEYEYTNDDAVVPHFDPTKTVFFGWTWANVVRREPTTGYLNTTTDNFAFDNINSPEDLAWLISLVNGLNRQTASPLSDKNIKQTADFNLQPYVWVPIGAMKAGCEKFGGTFDGQGHLIDYMDIAYIGDGDRRYERLNYGLFGGVDNGKINRTFVTSGYVYPVGTANIGGLIGSMNGDEAMVSNSEASVDIHSPENSIESIGGLVGVMNAGTIHSSTSMSILNSTSNNFIGGLVGSSSESQTKVYNSYSNIKYLITGNSPTIGGIIGKNLNTTIQNCYVHMQEGYTGLNTFALLVGESDGGTVSKCYVQTTQDNFPLSRMLAPGDDPYVSDCFKYNDVMSADNLGYLYYDNIVENDTTLYTRLNLNVPELPELSGTDYAYWARPTIPEINGDLPVPMLCDEDGEALHQGSFRSVGTYRGGHPLTGAFPEMDDDNPYTVLQYAGPIRDNEEIDAMLTRMGTFQNEDEPITDYLFIYGDIVNEIGAEPLDTDKLGKVSVYEHAAINIPGTLADYDNTYVGVSFDNSNGGATSTPDINHLGMQDLPRDWHMFSSSLQNAPLGFDYLGHNAPVNGHTDFDGVPHDDEGYYNNPWPYLDQQLEFHENTGIQNTEFTWLNGGGTTTGDNRYWMKAFNENDQSTDGYFPSLRPELFNDANGLPDLEAYPQLFIKDSDEHPGEARFRYPYGMDMFCWYEAEPHWINFKRNGPNHWHSDERIVNNHHVHYHLPYTENGVSNVNEDNLVVGKGYMASISMMTYLQSHGKLNNGTSSRTMTSVGSDVRGWNLVGNPYHAYLDFDLLAKNGTIDPYYVIYNADGYTGRPASAYIYYPQGGSNGGEYADKYLHPHQGFFVNAKSAELGFDEAMTVARNTATSSAFRSWRPNYPLVNLYLSSEKGCTDVTVVEFHRPEWGGATKQKELRQGNGLFYAYHEGEPYAALFTKEGTERVPLWFEAKEDDVFTISWNTANGYFNSLYLIDNKTGVQYDMLENESYVFEGRKEDYASRFYITFNCVDVEEHEEEIENSFAFFDGSEWVVTGEGTLELIDLQGRVLNRWRLTGGQSRVSMPNVAKSMYLLRLVNSQETKVQKIIAE